MNAIEFKNKILPLSDRLFPMVARLLCNDENARDAVQVIMMKLWDKRKQLTKHPNVSGFVFLTARNYCMDILRKNNPEVQDSDIYLQLVESGETVADELEFKELKNLITEILDKLPNQQKEVMILRELDGLEYNEISEMMGLNIDHIRVLLSRARKIVSVELKKIYSYEQG